MAIGERTLLERSEELERVDRTLRSAADGRGAVVLVEGPAGIGKTSLLGAAREAAAARALTVVSARGALLERELAWSVVRQLYAGVLAAAEPERAELLAGAAMLARPALGLDGSSDEAGALHGLYWLTAALCAAGPLFVAVDDAHWADLPSLRFLAYLGERIADLPLLLAVTVRTGERQHSHLQALGLRAERIVLRELSAEATAELTRTILGPEATAEFCAACHDASRGNPFILHELLLQLARDGIAPTAERAVEVAGVTPETVKRSLLLRLSVLPDDARELAATLAVLGGPAELRDAAAAASLDGGRAAPAADALTGAGLLAAGNPLQFAHPVIREVVYGELPSHERARRHGDAARRLAALGAEPRRVAVQLLNSTPDRDPWVVERLREAAREALEEGARLSGIGFLRRALDEPPPAEATPLVLRELAAAEALSRSTEAIRHLDQARATVRDPGLRAEIGLELALVLFRHGQMERGARIAGEVLADVPAAAGVRLIAAVVTAAALVPSLRPLLEQFLARLPDELPGDSPEACLALSARLAAAIARRRPLPEIGDLAARALGDGLLLRGLASHELIYWNVTGALIVSDRLESARAAIDAAAEDAARRGSQVGFALSACFRCYLRYRTGSITEGIADGWQALGATPPGEHQILAYAVAFLIHSLIEHGHAPDARALGTSSEFAGELPDVFAFHLLRVARARARIAVGDARAGVDELLAVGAALGDAELGPSMCPWRAHAAAGLCALGEHAQARALAEQELELARATASAWGEVLALHALAAAVPDDAEPLLERALECAAGHRLERARSLVALGALHRRRGRRTRGTELLREGLALSATCGARALEERARGELAAAGLKPRRRALSGAESLTPGELRVAQLAAEGRTNREIAQTLFVSLRTVETHLTHCYEKLRIGSRAELAAALGLP